MADEREMFSFIGDSAGERIRRALALYPPDTTDLERVESLRNLLEVERFFAGQLEGSYAHGRRDSITFALDAINSRWPNLPAFPLDSLKKPEASR